MADDNTADVLRAREAVDPGYIARLFHIESGGNPAAVTGSNRGLAQFGPREEAMYGINDQNRGDADAQAAAVQREAASHRDVLRRRLGRDPTNGEMYLTHQQGIAGGPALLTSEPDVPAWQAIRPFYKNENIARQAITGNIPRTDPLYGTDADKITAGQFRDMWIRKFERGAAPPASGPSAPGPPITPVVPASTGPSQVAAVPGAGQPSQTGQVPVTPPNAAGGDDELLRTLQALSSPQPQQQQAQQQQQPPMQINFPMAPGLDKARALALAMGRMKIA